MAPGMIEDCLLASEHQSALKQCMQSWPDDWPLFSHHSQAAIRSTSMSASTQACASAALGTP